MKNTNNAENDSGKEKNVEDFEKRAQRILDRLDRANDILDGVQAKTKKASRKSDKSVDVFQDVLEPIERGIKRLIGTSISQIKKAVEAPDKQRPPDFDNLARCFRSCSNEQLESIKKEIDKILEQRRTG